jgi:starch synthase
MDADLFHLFSPYGTNCTNLIKAGKIVSTFSRIIRNPSRNFIQSIRKSDLITITSNSLLNEFLSGACGQELKEALKQKKDNLLVITSGINKDVFNPETDNSIAQNYSKSYFTVGKKKCKESLLETFELNETAQLPVAAVILGQNPSDHEVNMLHDLFLQASDNLSIKLICIVPANMRSLGEFTKIATKNKNIRISHSYNHESVKRLLSGSDFYINLNQTEHDAYSILISLKYGSIPIVYKNGIVSEIITDIKINENGNGFLFDVYNIKDLSEALSWGLGFYKIKEKWTKLVKEAMGTDLTKEGTAKEYIKCYRKILDKSLASTFSNIVT